MVLPQSPAPRHSQEVTQQASRKPSSTQQRTPLRLSQKTSQPMEWTPTSTTAGGASQPAPPQLAELPVHYQANAQATRDCQYRQLSADASYGVTGSVPADWGKPHGSHRRRSSNDSPYQQRRGYRNARHRHTTTTHRRLMPQMDSQHAGHQQAQLCGLHNVQLAVHARRTKTTAVG